MNKKNQTNENINNWKFSKEIIEFIDSLLKIYCKIKNNSMYLKVSTNYWNISFVKIKDWDWDFSYKIDIEWEELLYINDNGIFFPKAIQLLLEENKLKIKIQEIIRQIILNNIKEIKIWKKILNLYQFIYLKNWESSNFQDIEINNYKFKSIDNGISISKWDMNFIYKFEESINWSYIYTISSDNNKIIFNIHSCLYAPA